MDVIKQYLSKIESALMRGDATEHTHRPALKTLIESFGLTALSVPVTATNEPRRSECGAPDFTVSIHEQTIGYIECKDVGRSLDEAEKSEQLKRYFTLGNIILTDYLEFRWYVDGHLRMAAKTARREKYSKLKHDRSGQKELTLLLQGFLSHQPKEIGSPKELAQKMARLTHMVRDIIIEALENEKASQILVDLRRAFAETLIPDLEKPGKTIEFSDMYAQTIAYGLFAARCNHQGKIGTFKRLGAAAEIPKTNPFLRKLFATITGPDIDDEPYAGFIDDLAVLLSYTDIAAVLEHFGKRTKQQDPVVHFYETFLAAYDPRLREARGVYYTPEPVVSYIIRSIDYLLQSRFGCKDGLADASLTTYLRDDNEVGKVIEESCHKTLILDPACGTGTFLYAVVDHVRNKFIQKNNAGMWSGYVRNHILPRLFGFELLMAPYAVAHLKLGMQLAAQDLPGKMRSQWAHNFEGGERLGIYLTNTLEEMTKKADSLFGLFRVISEEADAARNIKHDLPIMVIIGNPPYSNFGRMNKGKWILELLQDYKKCLKEKKLNIDDDFIKFIRWSQWRIEHTGAGILGLITNNTYIDGITHRRMRESLMETFDDIYILDLHGSGKKRELCPDGSKDENVFDIQQGVAISIFVKNPGKKKRKVRVQHQELWGRREEKYSWLMEKDISNTNWNLLKPTKDYFFFIPKDFSYKEEYRSFTGLKDIFLLSGPGAKTERDRVSIQWTRAEIESTVKDFRRLDEKSLKEKYELEQDSRDWKVANAKADVTANTAKELFHQILYRPFDLRYTWYSGQTRGFIGTPGYPAMQHMIHGKNLALLTCRQQAQTGFQHVFCSKNIVECCAVSLKTREITSIFPLYQFPDPETNGDLFSNGCARHVNLKPKFIAEASAKLDLKFIDQGQGDITTSASGKKRKILRTSFGPEDVFYYLYAILHSPSYRERYAEFLRIDFPRIPFTSNQDLFRELVILGQKMAALHLMEAFGPEITGFPIKGKNIVEQVRYAQPGQGSGDGRVWINNEQYFEGVPADLWAFHIGGYQVCHKWLKDRKGRELSYDDRQHYQHIVSALSETVRLMKEIDAVIEEYRGWPIDAR